MFLDKDLMKVKLEIEGKTYYFANSEQLRRGLDSTFALIRNANYIVEDGKFTKNRSTSHELPNAILAIGREEINKLFDFMEGK